MLTMRINISCLGVSFILLLHLVACGAIFLAALYFICKVLLLCILMASFYWHFYLDALQRGQRVITYLDLYHSGILHLYNKKKRLYQGYLQNSHFISFFLIIVYFKLHGSGQKKSVMIFRDAVGAESFRKLYVQLNFSGK